MDKYRLRLDEYTISAKDNCVLTTPQEAELAFLQQGICGKVMLVQAFKFVTELIPCDNGYGALSVMKYLWLCFCGDEDVVSLPLFYEDNEWNEVEYDDFLPVDSTTYIYRNQQLYVISVDTKKCVNVRQITLYYSQELVEVLCNSQNVKFKQIWLERMFSSYDCQEIGISWAILYDEVDEKGELTEKTMFLPVNVFDGPKMYEIGLENIESYWIDIGDSVEVSGVLYNLEKADDGKYILVKNNLQVSGKKVSQAKQYKELCSKIVLENLDEQTGVKLVPSYDLPKNKNKGKALIVSMKKDEN